MQRFLGCARAPHPGKPQRLRRQKATRPAPNMEKRGQKTAARLSDQDIRWPVMGRRSPLAPSEKSSAPRRARNEIARNFVSSFWREVRASKDESKNLSGGRSNERGDRTSPPQKADQRRPSRCRTTRPESTSTRSYLRHVLRTTAWESRPKAVGKNGKARNHGIVQAETEESGPENAEKSATRLKTKRPARAKRSNGSAAPRRGFSRTRSFPLRAPKK